MNALNNILPYLTAVFLGFMWLCSLMFSNKPRRSSCNRFICAKILVYIVGLNLLSRSLLEPAISSYF